MSGFNNNTDLSYDVNTASRLQNLLVGPIRDHVTLPKILVIVPDDDLLRYLIKKHATTVEAMERVINWLMCQYDHLLSTQKEYLPAKAKHYNHPMIVWIAPLEHCNFKSNSFREKFAYSLEKCALKHDNTFAVHLKKGGHMMIQPCTTGMMILSHRMAT